MVDATLLESDERRAAIGSPIGLTTDEARRRLAEYRSQCGQRSGAAPLAHLPGEILVAHRLTARSRICRRDRAREIRRSGGDRRFAPVQRDLGFHPGRTGRRGAGGAQEASRADGARPPRRRMGQASGIRAGARRRHHASARRAGARRCTPRVRISHGGPVYAHRRIRTDRCKSGRCGLCGRVGTPRPRGCGSHGDGIADLFRPRC